MFFSHGGHPVDGVYLRKSTAGYYGAVYSKAGASAVPAYDVNSADGNYHLVHVVRNDGYATVYLDGVPGAPVHVSTYGINGSRNLYFGCTEGPGYYWNSAISYVRLQNTALAYYQIQREVAAFQGILASRGNGRYVVPYFTRASTAPTNRKAGSVSQVWVPSNWPARSADQGLRIMESRAASTGNLLGYTGAFSTGWTKSGTCTVSSTSVVLPDGSTSTTATFKEGTDAGSEQSLSYAASSSLGVYCLSFYLRYNPAAGTPREWVRLYLDNGTNSKYYFFNVRHGIVGTTGGSLTGGCGIEPNGDGWFRYWVYASASGGSTRNVKLNIADADNSLVFDGQNQDSVFIAWPQLETNYFPGPYLPKPTSSSVTREADFCIVQPFNLNKELAGCVAATPRLLLNGSESLNGATVTPTVGAYTLTKTGTPQQGWSEAEGYHHLYNGSSDLLSSSSADFNPAGDFSVVCVYTPYSVSSDQTIYWQVGLIRRSERVARPGQQRHRHCQPNHERTSGNRFVCDVCRLPGDRETSTHYWNI